MLENKDGYFFKGSYQEFCEDQDIESYQNDIYEHWIVTEWLGKKLQDKGHTVIDFMNMTIWCRPTTGQAILLDGVISEICKDLEILTGQASSWEDKK